jgi:hypothetical protein
MSVATTIVPVSALLLYIRFQHSHKNGFLPARQHTLSRTKTNDKMNMNRVTPQKMTWREREMLKEKERVEREARMKEEARLAELRVTDTNFPALGGAGLEAKPKPATKSSFAKMASDWKAHSDLEEYREKKRREEEEKEMRRYGNQPMFRMSRFSPQPQDLEDDDQPARPQTQSEWDVVDTKKRRVVRDLTIEEMEERDKAQAEAEGSDYEQNADLGEKYRRNFY